MAVSFGLLFFFAPATTISILAIRPSAEAETLFRLYGAVITARGLFRHATFGVDEPRVVRRAWLRT